MNRKQSFVIIGIVTVGIIVTTLTFLYIEDQQFKARNTQERLEAVFSHCNCTPDETIPLDCPSVMVEWQNSTHYINNDICEFQLLS